MGLGLGWDADLGQDVISRTTGSTKSSSRTICCDRRRTTPSRKPISQAAATAATSTCGRCISTASPPSTIRNWCPIVHPVLEHDYTVGRPILGGELSFHSNLTSLTRANPPPLTRSRRRPPTAAYARSRTRIRRPRPRAIACCAGSPAPTRASRPRPTWRRTIVDSYGQVFTPFVSLRGDVANVNMQAEPASPTTSRPARPMWRASCRPSASNTATRSSMCNPGARRPSSRLRKSSCARTKPASALPNEDAQSLIFDASNLFRVDKFSGWDRVEGGGRLNAGVHYTAQFNRGGYFNALFGQSYQLFGQNSFALGGTTNTGIGSGLDTNALRLRGAADISAEFAIFVHVAVPLRPDGFHAATQRIRNHRQFRPLDDHAGLRQLRRPARARLPGPPRRASSQQAGFKVTPNWSCSGAPAMTSRPTRSAAPRSASDMSTIASSWP